MNCEPRRPSKFEFLRHRRSPARDLAEKRLGPDAHTLCIGHDVARHLRPRVIGQTQHVIQRGNNKSDIFRSAEDYDLFLEALSEASSRHDMNVNGYVLMTNHVHLMVTPGAADAVSLAMQAIGRRYVYYFNRKYGRTGGLFEGRYRSMIVYTEMYWYRCMRYVELNPVRAGLVAEPDEYRWSSYKAHALGMADSIIVQHPLYLCLGATPAARQEAWREICHEALPEDQLTELRRAVQRGTRVRPR